ncbi:TonB-dependent receptor [Constantimarinum furrinae]|uniref:TonB-dependent receptor n=1 Tax=Constantimarinum furrinae TaxID=2562285 RepID=UPI00164C282A|nr:TonB-dependent receptor [Constantimarinum furrinae]
MLFLSGVLAAQNSELTGRVVDSEKNPLAYASVVLYEEGSEVSLFGASTNEEGVFVIEEVPPKTYRITFSYIGFKTREETFTVGENSVIGTIILEEEAETLEETIITNRAPTLIKEPGKLIFNVENTSLSTGNTLNLLSKTPGVLLIQGSISIKNTAPTVYINNKRVYLSSTEILSLLSNTDASNIKSVEVITNPSAQYDADAGTVLNLVTSRPISVGYKGSVNGTYEQAVYPKYSYGTAHFYKNNWVSLYASYAINSRKEFKDQRDFIRYFNPDGSVKSIWNSDFDRTTTANAHQGNVIADFTLNEKNTLSFSSNILVAPNKEFNNNVFATIRNAQQQIDSTFITRSYLNNDKSNLSFNLAHKLIIGEQGATVKTAVNYIRYNDDQFQDVNTTYFSPNGEVLRNNSFFTQAIQESDIITGQIDLASPFMSGDLNTGLKYSNIDTQSGLDFFDTNSLITTLDLTLSDDFMYEESIYAGYISFSREWEQWALEAGLRGEYTDVAGNSRSLGVVNTQEYFELFPSASVHYTINENNSMGLSYARHITRPRYQSLNPFKYFLNENNFNAGNPNLVPAIDNKITLDYNYKNTWFVELYYHRTEETLSLLNFQDNTNSIIRSIDANLIGDFQYSLDLIYASSVASWWYLSIYTSSFYFENEFFSVESVPLTYTNSTYGFYGQLYSGITLSEKASLSSDITAVYLSNFIYGSYTYGDQFNLSVSFQKTFWDNRASLTLGVDDIFNTYNVPVTSKYYNQDNSYFAMPESRLFRLGFKYTFGNAILRDNKRSTKTTEEVRLEKN